MFKPQEGIGRYGTSVPGPPWILGHRGAPRQAPENTLSGLQLAMALGLDGFEYDLRTCATGEPILLHDETLDRTTNARGTLHERTLPELFGVDAGSWFDQRFAGEPLPLLSEVLEIEGPAAGKLPQHMIELKEDGLVAEVARQLAERGRQMTVRVASSSRRTCLEARDAGLAAMLLAREANRDDLLFARDERLAAVCVKGRGWEAPDGEESWPCERWAWSVDEPADLLAACRAPLNAFNTNEPLRALATRALVTLAPDDDAPYPVQAPDLTVEPGGLSGGRGEWCGQWEVNALVRNPFGFKVRVLCGLRVRRGAFEVEGLPAAIELPPGAQGELAFQLTGGSWSPGGDPLLEAHYRWRKGPGRPAEGLCLDAPLHRRRELVLRAEAVRLPMLRESPLAGDASMSVRRHGRYLLVSIENPGALEAARTLVHLDGRTHRGGRGIRLILPEDFDSGEGLPFSCGMEGREAGRRRVRRWAGAVPSELDAGVAGWLLPGARA